MPNTTIIKPEWIPSGYSEPPKADKPAIPAAPVKPAVRQLADRVRKRR